MLLSGIVYLSDLITICECRCSTLTFTSFMNKIVSAELKSDKVFINQEILVFLSRVPVDGSHFL